MENLTIVQTQYTPNIILDADKDLIEIRGKSYPENTFEFYKPVMDWMEEYFKCYDKKKTTVNMEIIYFNSSSSKLFFDLFDLLDEAKEKCDIEVNWIFDKENESAKEAGEDFIDDFKDLNIRLVEKE